jgi:hypothetical protein
MRQVREVLRLTTVGVGLNEIARRVGVAPSTVRLGLSPAREPLGYTGYRERPGLFRNYLSREIVLFPTL